VQAYRARYERGRVVPLGDVEVPEGSDLIVTVLDALTPDNTILRQQKAVSEFLEGIRNSGEPLGAEFDKAISNRFNIARGLDV